MLANMDEKRAGGSLSGVAGSRWRLPLCQGESCPVCRLQAAVEPRHCFRSVSHLGNRWWSRQAAQRAILRSIQGSQRQRQRQRQAESGLCCFPKTVAKTTVTNLKAVPSFSRCQVKQRPGRLCPAYPRARPERFCKSWNPPTPPPPPSLLPWSFRPVLIIPDSQQHNPGNASRGISR